MELLTLQVTIFSLIAVGFLLKRIRLIGVEGQKNITDLVINVVLPCNIVTSFAVDLGTDMVRDGIAILLISIALQASMMLYGHFLFRRDNPDHHVNVAYAMISSNAGFLGNPIAEGVFGATGLALASIYLIPQRIMMWSEGIRMYSSRPAETGRNSGTAAGMETGTIPRIKTGTEQKEAAVSNGQLLKKVLTHPCIIACAIGIVLMAFGIDLPPVIMTPVQTLGRCNTALSMLVIGMILAEIDLPTLVDREVIYYTIHRLVIVPLILYLILGLLPVSPLVRGVSTLLAAMPAAATTSMLAVKYDRDPHFATRLVIFSTLCSIPAILIWSMILQV